MSLTRETARAVRMTLVLWVLTAVLYPLLILAIGQVAFPFQANGSLIQNGETVVGSALIGQEFQSDEYFWSRPSTINYSQGEDAAPTGLSGASNLAPGNSDLLERIEQSVDQLLAAGIQPTADLVYASGSGLDPHVAIATAQAQINRVAQARKLSPDQIQPLIKQHTDRRFLGIFGEPGVNILNLNLALDQLN
ncbi:MAG: K(+)-transporting ATPase subunit C [Leptolyngbyaceae cyanobacterium SL_5_9]|nr:K(+)-transporting ATPase subunit C [Leptolyngbyaceae cyanobacterium SL_5_9]